MTTKIKHRTASTLVFSELYNGVPADAMCSCGGRADEHLVRTTKTGQRSTWCEHCRPCTGFDNGWNRQSVFMARAENVLEHSCIDETAIFLWKTIALPITEDAIKDSTRNGMRTNTVSIPVGNNFAYLISRLQPTIERLAGEMGLRLGALGQVELTLMQAFGHFQRHVDGDYLETPGPKVSFVYYVGDRTSFTGGELKFKSHTTIVEPADNSLVVFKGDEQAHEVLPVRGEQARRLTVNGWFYRG